MSSVNGSIGATPPGNSGGANGEPTGQFTLQTGPQNQASSSVVQKPGDQGSHGKSRSANHSQPTYRGPVLYIAGPGVQTTGYGLGGAPNQFGMFSRVVVAPIDGPQSSEKFDALKVMCESYKMTTGENLPMGHTSRSTT